ncbi:MULTISPECIES: acetamidase/formamidase family protein [unclassified Pseudonocardia]|jgi:acetamidase/formamidase|uniref:acetamidase/formamidase family protein n=1 Tax=unclassified Pseudonocardia TaxID=2619320 RepID=UPI000316EA68|nr:MULTISPECIES: acetamidase/formamidase family protein [unclassified Pseudonocardia]ALE76114.1 acetamidase [Pseudonocardia sp. EC080625-04]ALL78769.1 acetamidase [Pseudonocardia sp. EC080610-09]ALL84976.1 acetamidase [Pseudonocardia sp. EC080619-01]OLM19350.1 amidase [Pseudonocardia sp. Ae707_Ps1]
MQVVEYRPERHEFAWTFGGAPPTHRIAPGTCLRLWTEDAFSGRITSTTDRPTDVLDMAEVNPQTGPFFVEGAEPGDTLALHIVELTPARDWGASTTIPFFGALSVTERTALLHEPLPERVWIYQLDRDAGTVRFEATSADLQLDLPCNPMLGTVGVAPPAREVRSSLVPDVFGGNMDTPEMRAGATCFLRVNVEGALFSVGDGHYRQGEGESCGTAVEGAMDVVLLVELVKGAPAPAWPRIETDTHYVVVGSSRPLEDAWRASQVGMIAWLGELYGLDRLDAYQLLTQAAESPLANVVDTNYSAVTKIAKALLPDAAAYNGVHRHLREQARSL